MFENTKGIDNMHLGRIFGIDVSAHWSLFLILVYFAVAGVFGPPLVSFLIALILFFIVLLHEFGHSLMGKAVGFKADKINLNFLGGIAFIDNEKKPENIKWWKEFLCIAAGPAVNVAIFILMFFVGPLLGYYNIADLRNGETDSEVIANIGLGAYVFYYVHLLNLILLIFNMIPAYPLDGGQILHSLFWGTLRLFKVKRARALSGMACSILGLIAAAFLLVFGIMNTAFIMAFIAIFIGFVAIVSFDKFKEDYNNRVYV